MRLEAFFLPGGQRDADQRFCLYYPARGGVAKGLVIYIHPLAEEMNKSRRMAAQQSCAFTQAGYTVLQVDLQGCGDSSGDFGDATWQQWVSDVVMACHWLRKRCAAHLTGGSPPALWLWGLRTGCLLAVEASCQLNEACHFLFWQPPVSGKVMLQQFLRLKVAGNLLGGQAHGAMANLRSSLASGQAVEIAGYMLSSTLASGLEQARLAPPVTSRPARRLVWLEVSSLEDAALSPVSNQTLTAWCQAGFDTHAQVLHGPAFWQTTEIEEVPSLITASTAAVSGGSRLSAPEALAA